MAAGLLLPRGLSPLRRRRQRRPLRDDLPLHRDRVLSPARSAFDVALAATLHDPTGALAGDIRRGVPLLRRLYRTIAVATSPTTSARAIDALATADAHAGTPASDARGPLYRLALQGALAGGAGRIHYLDFDRALHWLWRGARGPTSARRKVPRELAAVLRVPRNRAVVIVGRTPHAHRSHQRPLWITETGVNAHFAKRLGIAGRVDFLAPSFIADRDTIRRLVARSRARDGRIYGELVALLAGLASGFLYVECDGLDWETPDRHRALVARIGLARWRQRFDTAAEWRLRTAFVAQFVDGFERALARHPAGRVALSRVRLRSRAGS